MFTGVRITDEIRTALFETACLMVVADDDTRDIAHDEFEGRLTTNFKHAVLGGISGYVFEAEIECNNGKGHVRYIVRPNDIWARVVEEGVWTSFPFMGPMPEPQYYN